MKMICLLDGDAKLPFQGDLINLKRPLSKRLIDYKGWKQLAEVISNFKPDIIQANAGDTLKFAISSKLFFWWKVPVVYRNANKVSDFVSSLPKLLLNKFFVHRLSHVISVSELCRLDFIKTYSFSEGKTTMIPIGIESISVEKFIPQDLQEYFVNGRVLVNIGSLVPEKNHGGLLRITQQLIKDYPTLKVLILGDGKLRQALNNKIDELKLKDHVFLLGYRNDVLSVLSSADGMLLPSLIEGLPGVILEAFYCRIPVVAYNVGGISEVVQHRNTGWLIDKNNEPDFVEAVKEMLNEVDLVGKVRDKAFQLVDMQFNNQDIAKRFAGVYHKVASQYSCQ